MILRISQIDYHDEEMGDVECIDVGDISSLSGAEDEAGSLSGPEHEDLTSELVHGDEAGGVDADNNDCIVSELSPGDLRDTTDKNQGAYSDGWLLSGDEQENVEEYWKTVEDQQPESTNDVCRTEKDSQSEDQHAPDIKVSAITGVGLQELLEIIDEKLKTLDNKRKSPNVVERDFFNTKWRPPRREDSAVSVEQ